MAEYSRKKTETAVSYKTLKLALENAPPARVYMLRGEEDYLRDQYLALLREKCVPEGLDSFNYRRINGPKLDLQVLSEAMESMPFMGERTLIEIRDFDINKTGDYDGQQFAKLLADVPEWATLAFVFAPDYAPDGRIGPVKALKKYGVEAVFTAQGEELLVLWVIKHFAAEGKNCDKPTARHLLEMCGSLMNTLAPEILKVAGVTAGDTVTARDIDAVVTPPITTTIFNMTDALGEGKFDRAARLLADVLNRGDEVPVKIMYMISEQFAHLYAVKLGGEGPAGKQYLLDCFPEMAGRSFLIPKLQAAVRAYSLPRLARAVELCADAEFAMRDGGGTEDAELLSELLLRLAMDKNDV